MAEIAGEGYIPRRAWPGLVRPNLPSPAFGQGPSDATPRGDMRSIAPEPYRAPDPFPVIFTSATAASAGNKVRLGTVGVLYEYWCNRRRMSGDFFVSNPADHRRIVARRQARVRRLDRIVANRQVSYEPKSYGS